MAAKIAKILAAFVDKRKLGKKLGILVLSIAFGLIFLLVLPVVAMKSLGNLSGNSVAPTIDPAYLTESNIKAHMSDSNREKVERMEREGQEIETKMNELGIREQTIKAQLIYMTEFDRLTNFDADAFCNLFLYAADDRSLLDSINQNYGLAIDYNEFMRTYIFIMNSTINKYMFTDTSTKNAADLAAWAENAYLSEWHYSDNFYGERSGEDRLRCADNVGLIMGYIRYDAENKVFTSDTVDMYYTKQGSIDTIPDVKGVGVYNGSEFGVYVGNGEVVFSSAMGGVQCQALTDGGWTAWCTFDAITYPQEVQDRINELHEPATETTITEGE